MVVTLSPHRCSVRRRRSAAAALVGLVSAVALIGLTGSAQAAPSPVPLGDAGSFAVLAGSAITNTGVSTISGDLGVYPTPSQTGTGNCSAGAVDCVVLTGVNHGGDATTQRAKTALTTAYNAAAGQLEDAKVSADLAGRTLVAGVYEADSSMGLSGVLTLDGANDPDSVFVFQAGSTLTTASNSRVLLINGAQACNVFWQVGSSATLGTTTQFVGTILAGTSITLTTGAQVHGRVLARGGAVTLDSNTVTRPGCAQPAVPADGASPTASPVQAQPNTGGGVPVSITVSPSPSRATPTPTATPAPSAVAQPVATAVRPSPTPIVHVPFGEQGTTPVGPAPTRPAGSS
ncbi:MAG: hypothetical protein JWN57_34, partial [Frankiales bacterium]|nr:hypothetical protein [Frankiales bacterium]